MYTKRKEVFVRKRVKQVKEALLPSSFPLSPRYGMRVYDRRHQAKVKQVKVKQQNS